MKRSQYPAIFQDTPGVEANGFYPGFAWPLPLVVGIGIALRLACFAQSLLLQALVRLCFGKFFDALQDEVADRLRFLHIAARL